MLIDLQLHSTYSDGYLTPTEVAEYIAKKGVKVAALTDHNTVGGVHEFRHACKKNGIKAITGLELYMKYGSRKFNLLWYNFDENSPLLHDILRDSQVRRRKMFRSALTRLKKKGFNLEVDHILDRYTHYVPLNHIVDEILKDKGNIEKIKKELKVKDVREESVISEYLRDKKTGKLKNSFINLKRILELQKKIGGTLVLCHPAKHSYLKEDFIKKLKTFGVEGIEILSPHHSYGAVMNIQYLAKKFDLIETGGSDFHRKEGGTALIQNSWNYFKIDSNYLKGIERIIDKK